MRFIPTIVHGLADYLVGAIVIGLPFYFGWPGAPGGAFVAMGVIVVLYSLLTDYELGIVRSLRIRLHLPLDAVFGVAMLAAPTVLDIPIDVRAPVHAIGVLAVFLVFTTKVRAQDTESQSEATA